MRLYELSDMVKADCRDCTGCSSCCQGMGDTVVLDPLDIYRLTGALQRSFAELLEDCVELHVEDGLILPNLRMTGEGESCVFLNREGRCSIHAFRPGLCRTFPLGRNYEDGKLSYFLVEDGCPKKNKAKVKVSKWIDTPDLKQNHAFLVKWHYLVKSLKEDAVNCSTEALKDRSMRFLQTFYLTPYEEKRDFYSQFQERVSLIQDVF